MFVMNFLVTSKESYWWPIKSAKTDPSKCGLARPVHLQSTSFNKTLLNSSSYFGCTRIKGDGEPNFFVFLSQVLSFKTLSFTCLTVWIFLHNPIAQFVKKYSLLCLKNTLFTITPANWSLLIPSHKYNYLRVEEHQLHILSAMHFLELVA